MGKQKAKSRKQKAKMSQPPIFAFCFLLFALPAERNG
jgi:hypothetical protein